MINILKSIFSSGPKMAVSILVLIILWLCLGIFFSGSSQDSEEGSKTKDASSISKQDKPLPEVLVEIVEAEAFQREVVILGETRFSRRVMISALTDGRVVSISEQEGEQLSKNTVVIKIDNREAKALFNHAKSLAEQKRMELAGYEKLFSEELISAASLAEARAEFEGAEAQKIQQTIKLESTQVSLPFDGVLQKILVEEGDYVRLGQDLAEVLDFSPFIVKGAVTEKDAAFVEQDKKAMAKLISGEIYQGTIAYKSKLADADSRSFQIELEIPNKENSPILSGISSTITIPVVYKEAHKLSASVLEIDVDGKFGVKVIDENDVVSFNPIEVIKSSNEGIWATGLPSTAKVIIRGQGFVKSGDSVRAVFKKLELYESESISDQEKSLPADDREQISLPPVQSDTP